MINLHVPENLLIRLIFCEDVDIVDYPKAYRILSEIFHSLDWREQKAIDLRILRGLTLEESGRVAGVTRERIRQWEAIGLRKLRHPVRIKKLAKYVRESQPAEVMKDL